MCENALQKYGEFLRTNKLVPVPVFWSGPNCQSTRYPATVEEASAGNFVLPFEPRSYYIPRYTTFSGASGQTKRETFGSPSAEILVEDTNADIIEAAFGVLTTHKGLRFKNYWRDFQWTISTDPNVAPELLTRDDMKFKACNGLSLTVGTELSAFEPQSWACDSIMEGYCAKGGRYENEPECVCFRDREHLKALAPETSLPVRCLGQRCAAGGYRTAAMESQGCSITLCQNAIRAHGADLTIDNNTMIQCGGVVYNEDGSTLDSKAQASATPSVGLKAPSWWTPQLDYIVAIAAGLILLGLMVGIAVRWG